MTVVMTLNESEHENEQRGHAHRSHKNPFAKPKLQVPFKHSKSSPVTLPRDITNIRRHSMPCCPKSPREPAATCCSHGSKKSNGATNGNGNNNNNNNNNDQRHMDDSVDDFDDEVAEALEIARDHPRDYQYRYPTVRSLLEKELARIWARIKESPRGYVMTQDEFAVFNFFRSRFQDNEIAAAAIGRYWDALHVE